MDDDRQIEAELQRNFHLLDSSPPKLLNRSSPKFLHDIVALVALFNHAHTSTRSYPIPFLDAIAISARG